MVSTRVLRMHNRAELPRLIDNYRSKVSSGAGERRFHVLPSRLSRRVPERAVTSSANVYHIAVAIQNPWGRNDTKRGFHAPTSICSIKQDNPYWPILSSPTFSIWSPLVPYLAQGCKNKMGKSPRREKKENGDFAAKITTLLSRQNACF